MPILYSFLFMFIIAGALGVLYVYNYNRLQHTKTKIEHAECLIDEALRNKYDLIVQYEKLILDEVKIDKNFLKDFSKLKDDNISNFDLDRKLTDYANTIAKVKADYEDLGDNKEFKKLVNEEKKIDEKLQAAKSYYNKYTSEMNDLIRAFPSNIVSRMHRFDIKTFFDGKNMQDEIVDDFKL